MNIEIRIPKLNLTAPVVDIFLGGDTWDMDKLAGNVGRLDGTGRFDQPDNVVLTAHAVSADGEPGVFGRLDSLNSGDTIVIRRDGNDHSYNVSSSKRVKQDDMSVVQPSLKARLTLLACALDSYDEARGEYLERHVVIAEPVEAATAEAPSTPFIDEEDVSEATLADAW